jgi:polyvinyl alcohol dehydrogenase (cytochrome)
LRPPEAVIEALVNGSMRAQGSTMTGPERRAVAEFVTGKAMGGDVIGASVGRCATVKPFAMVGNEPAWSGWGPDPGNTRFQPAPAAGLSATDLPNLTLKWAFGFPDASSAWAQPNIAGGRVFVGSQNGTVYSLDGQSGCIYWTFSASGGVRTAMTIARRPNAQGYAAYFGDTNGNAYAVDAATGALLWKREVDEHPLARITGSPTLYNGRLYVPLTSYEESQGSNPSYECCTFRGSVVAVDAATGAIVWKTYMIDELPKPRGKSTTGATLYGPAGATIWSAPAIDIKRGAIYVATGNTYSDPPQPSSDAVVALDLATGKVRWMKQSTPDDTYVSGCRSGGTNPNCSAQVGPDYDFGNSPILAKLPNGKDAIVIGQKSGVAWAFDPDNKGSVLWKYQAGQGSALGGIEWGSAVDGKNAYFPVSDILAPRPGGLHAVDLVTGQRVWYTPPPAPKCGTGRGCNGAQSAAIAVIPGVVFSGSVDGALRAFSTTDGRILWEFDSNREFKTLNGVPARGGSMIGPGPVVAGGLLVVNSGFGAFGGRPGNVLLAFSVDRH